jgi:predicted dehydrogenase
MTGPLRIGFIGLGGIARRRHIPALGEIDGVAITAVANRRPDSSARAAAEFGIDRTFEDWRDLVAWDGIDIVWCATYPDQHRAVTEAALAAGKHVFCQARMAPTLTDAQAMLAAAQRSDRTTILCSYSQYLRGDLTVRRLVDDGWLGRITGMVIRSESDRYVDPGDPIHWRQRAATFGRNILDLGQLIEVQHRWVGPSVRVTAMGWTMTSERRDDGAGATVPVDRPDALSVVGELAAGGLVTYVLSGVAPLSGDEDAIELYGDQGSIVYRSTGDRILAGRRGGPLQEVAIAVADEPSRTVEQTFIDAIRAGIPLAGPPSFSDGVRYMAEVEAIDQAVISGRTVEVPSDLA